MSMSYNVQRLLLALVALLALTAVPAPAHATGMSDQVRKFLAGRSRIRKHAHQVDSVTDEVVDECSCACCETEESRDNVGALPPDTVELACAVAPLSSADLARREQKSFLKTADRCHRAGSGGNSNSDDPAADGGQCRQPDTDAILERSDSFTLDYARFCRAECEPTHPRRGATCSRRANDASSAARRDFVHFVHKRSSSKGPDRVQLAMRRRHAAQQALAASASANAADAGTSAADPADETQALVDQANGIAQQAEKSALAADGDAKK